jgi:hypothetical protein
MTGIEAGLQNLSSEFRTAFETLAERLTDIASQQQEGLYDKNAEAMRALQSRVADVAKLIEANSLAHGVLVTSVKERAHESRVAIDYMREASERLGGTLTSILALTERADTSLKDLRDASVTLVQGSDGVLLTTRALEASVSSIRPGIETLVRSLGEAGTAIARMADESRAAWEASTERVMEKLRETPRSVSATPSVDSGSGEILTVLRRIASSTQNSAPARQSVIAAAIPSLIGTLVGGGIVYAILKFL